MQFAFIIPISALWLRIFITFQHFKRWTLVLSRTWIPCVTTAKHSLYLCLFHVLVLCTYSMYSVSAGLATHSCFSLRVYHQTTLLIVTWEAKSHLIFIHFQCAIKLLLWFQTSLFPCAPPGQTALQQLCLSATARVRGCRVEMESKRWRETDLYKEREGRAGVVGVGGARV